MSNYKKIMLTSGIMQKEVLTNVNALIHASTNRY